MYKKMHRLLLKSEGNSVLSRKPHFIFSAENPLYDKKLNMSHDDVMSFLRGKGYNVEEMDGHYGAPELSIIVHEPNAESIPHLHKLARDLGQESGIQSDGTNHELHFYNGENSGKYVKGSGTNFHKVAPKDFYSLMSDGTLFTHNLDMNNWFTNREFQKSEQDERYLEHYSPQEGLKTISPFQMGTGVDKRQRASQNRQSQMSFYYPQGYQEPEPIVTRQAKSKYTVKVPQEAKIFDSQVHGSDIINQVKQANQGAFNMDMFVDALKQAGYSGFKSRPQGIEMIAMFNELPVHEESPIQPFQIKKSETLEKRYIDYESPKEQRHIPEGVDPRDMSDGLTILGGKEAWENDPHIGGGIMHPTWHQAIKETGQVKKVPVKLTQNWRRHSEDLDSGYNEMWHKGGPKTKERILNKPIIVAQDRYGRTQVLDGQHRLNQAIKEGRSHINALIVQAPKKFSFRKTETLEKGAMKRVAPFNPKNVDEEERYDIDRWQERDTYDRDEIPAMDPNAKLRALNKLSARTKTKLDKDGKRLFLLHRGVGDEEARSATEGEGSISHEERTSWTPHTKIARNFAEQYRGDDLYSPENNMFSAWIHEDNIHHIPNAYGDLEFDGDVTQNKYNDEFEVIVNPHKSQPMGYDESSDETSPNNIDEAINARGKLGGTWLGRQFADKYYRRKLARKKRFGKNENWNDKQHNWLRNDYEGIAYYTMHPKDFLKLTTANDQEVDAIMNQAKPHDFYESPEVKSDMIVAPHITIDDTGKIHGHEGRHRAAAALKAGHDKFTVGIVAKESGWPADKYGWKWKRNLKTPTHLGGEFSEHQYEIKPFNLKPIERIKKSEYLLHEPVVDMFKTEEEVFETLEKGRKDILQMFGQQVEPHQKEFADWASKKLPNKDWQIWATRNYRKNPETFTPEVKQELEHFGGSQHIPEVGKVRFDKTHDLNSGIQMFQDAYDSYNKRISSKTNIVKPRNTTRPFFEQTSGDRGWFSLGTGACEEEGKAMGHCGNAPSVVEGDDIYSLRTVHRLKDSEYHEPHLTFIANNGFLGEMKGRANQKPTEEYHQDIAGLLKDPRIKGIVGGGYAQESNFQFSDLSPELQKDVLKHNPNLITDPTDPDQVDKILDTVAPDKHKDDLYWEVANMTNLTPEQQGRLVEKGGRDVAVRVAKRKDFDSNLAAKMLSLHQYDHKVERTLAKNPAISEDVQDMLMNSMREDTISTLAGNPGLDKRLQKWLAHNSNSRSTLSSLASNKNLDPELFDKLIDNDSPRVVERMANRGDLNSKQIDSIIGHLHDKFEYGDGLYMIDMLAENKDLQPHQIEKLLHRLDYKNQRHRSDTLTKFAEHKNLPKHMFNDMVQNPSNFVRNTMARREDLTPYHQKMIIDNVKPKTFPTGMNEVDFLASNPSLVPTLQKVLFEKNTGSLPENIEVLHNLAKNPKLIKPLQEELLKKDSFVRANTLKNPNLDSSLYKKAVNHNDSSWRAGVAKNPSLPLDLQKQLSMDKENTVVEALLQNQNLDLDVAKDIQNRWPKHSYVWDLADYTIRKKNKKYQENIRKAEDDLSFTPKISKTNHSDLIRNIASSYAKAKGIQNYNHPTRKAQVNKDRAAKIAAAYHEMKHDPDHPDVKSAYDALINETMDQWNHIKQTGLKVSKITPNMENPYKTSKDLFKDVRENNHMWYFPTDQGFGSKPGEEVKHPLLKPVNEKHDGEPMVANDIFRIVHDYFGHAKEGYQFGPVGEENAWHEHRKMFSPLAQKALTSETRGQNSWVNFGPHGENNRKNPANTIYADQKAGLLPDWAYEHDDEDFTKSEGIKKFEPTGKGPKTKPSPSRPFYLVHDEDHPTEGYYINFTNKDGTHDIHHISHKTGSEIAQVKDIALNSAKMLSGKNKIQDYEFQDQVFQLPIIRGIFEMADPTGETDLSTDNWHFSKSEDKKREIKRGDHVHLSSGTIDHSEPGHLKIDRTKKYVVHGHSKRGERAHWVVPHGEKDSRKGFYHRADRTHHVDDVAAHDAKKMKKSIGPLQLKGLKDITTRPDQQVMQIGNARQADIARRSLMEQQRRHDPQDVDLVNRVVSKPLEQLAHSSKIYQGKKRRIDQAEAELGLGNEMTPRQKKVRDEAIGMTGAGFQGANINLPESGEPSKAVVPTQHFNQPIGQHEAHHHLFDEVARKYGDSARHDLVNHLYDNIDPKLQAKLTKVLTKKGYRMNHKFKEEMVNYVHDMVTHHPSRRDFFTALGIEDEQVKRQIMGSAKKSWKNLRNAAKQVTPEFFKNEELEKNMKGIRAGVLTAALGLSQPAIADEPKPPVPNQVINHDQRAPENNKNRILNAISMVESSGGKNTEHERLPANSIHQGERAFGSYGLTPLLIRETINLHKDLARKYGNLKELRGDKFHEAMQEHPELEHTIASRHYDRLARKFGHDPAKIGYAWLNGIVGTMKAIKNNSDINNHWHVMKIMDAYKKSKSGQ